MKMSDDFTDPVTSWLDTLDGATEHPPLLQHQDGRWSVVDDDGWPSDPIALGHVGMLDGASTAALDSAAIDIEPTSITDTEADEPNGAP